MELYVEDFLKKSSLRGHDPSYPEIDIYEERGFDDYRQITDHRAIQDVLKQFALIDPSRIQQTFRPEDSYQPAKQQAIR